MVLGSPGTRDPAEGWPGLEPEAESRHGVAVFLAANGYALLPAAPQDGPFVAAEAGACRLVAASVAPQGWHRDLVRRAAGPEDRVAFAFADRLLDDQPLWRSWTHHHLRWLAGYAGLRLPARPVLALVASPGCDLASLPWRSFTEPERWGARAAAPCEHMVSTI